MSTVSIRRSPGASVSWAEMVCTYLTHQYRCVLVGCVNIQSNSVFLLLLPVLEFLSGQTDTKLNGSGMGKAARLRRGSLGCSPAGMEGWAPGCEDGTQLPVPPSPQPQTLLF